MKILIDIGGTDDGFEVPITAACELVDQIIPTICLIGIKKDIEATLKKIGKESYLSKFELIECTEYISNDDEPVFAIKHKKESNLVVAFDYLKQQEDMCLISASSTGALMAGALLKIGRIKGIHRPALITILPTLLGKEIVFLDTGANPEAKMVSLLQYAKLGMLYATEVMKISNPALALLNIGKEEKKGTPELKEAFQKLKIEYPNFYGNIEARYLLNGQVDIVVCDGLMGNVAIKSLEGAVTTLKRGISSEFNASIKNKVIGFFAKPVLKKALQKFSYKEKGGAILLGVKKPIIKVHGSSSKASYVAAINQACELFENHVIEKIEEEMKKPAIE